MKAGTQGLARALEVVELVQALGEEEREQQVTELCAGHERLEEQVRALLSGPPTSFLGTPLLHMPWVQKGTRAPGHVVLEGKYELQECIGTGSMGVVYRGLHLQLEKQVAIKFILSHPESSELDLARLVHEANAAAGVRHENVVAVHDVGLSEGRPYMVMDWVEGVDLQAWMVKARDQKSFEDPVAHLPLREFVESELGHPCSGPLWSRPYAEIVAFVVMRIALAVHEAHKQGMIHRDVAPKNILLTSDGRPVLVDFGIATLIGDGETQATRGSLAGTLPYMAPEQFTAGPPARKPAVDIYALGATLYHLLCGRAPFDVEAGFIGARIALEMPPDLATLRPDIPADLIAICFGAMEKKPEARYASAALMAEDLQAFLERRPVSRYTPGLCGRLGRWCQRRPLLAVAASLVFALSAASVVVGVMLQREWARQALIDHQQEFAANMRRLPALATFEANAAYNAAPIRAHADEQLPEILGQLVALEPERPLLRWYRVNYRSQVGALDGCAQDLQVLREQGHSTPIFEALALQLLSEQPNERNQLVAPEELPEPVAASAFDHAMIGYVAHRWRKSQTALTALNKAVELAPEEWLYRDLRILPAMVPRDGELAVEDALRVEAALGLGTPRTMHARAYAASLAARDDEARQLWGEVLTLVPDQHQALHGLGLLSYWNGDFEAAEEHFTRAIEVKEGSWTSYLMQSRCADARGDDTEALRILGAGRADLPAGAPSGAFPPVMELALEEAYVLLKSAMLLQQENASEARVRFERVQRLIAPLLAVTREDDSALAIELSAFQVQLECKLGVRTPDETLAELHALSRDYLELTQKTSAVIATNIGLQLIELGEEHHLEAESWLRMALSDPQAYAVAKHGLEQLEATRLEDH